jgi:oligoendopeptidase F
LAQAVELTGAEDVRWNLGELYASPEDPAIERTLAEALAFARDFEQRYRARVAELSPDEFATMMEELGRFYEESSRPSLYAHLLHSLDTSGAAAGKLLARVREAGAEQGRHLVFINLELAQLTDEQVAVLYRDPRVAPYEHAVEQERRYRTHQLTEVEERLLTDISPVGTGAWTRLFEEQAAAIRVELDGSQMPIEPALARLYDADRTVRETASHAVTEALQKDLRTRGYILNVLLQDKSIGDRLRHYPSWISSRNLANETSDESVRALVDAVTGRYDIVDRYYRVKRRLLGLDELHEWDRYAPIREASRQLRWEEARDVVIGSYHRFSRRAGKIIEGFFDRGWIDAPVVDGKQGGAYCAAATPSLHPYVLLNFTGRQRDVLVLAHELGHGLHDVLASARNHIFDFHPPLTLAETASVFGEALTFDAIMSQEKDPEVRLSLLCHQVEDAFATIFRQIAMNRFEDAVHTARREQGELAPEQIGEIWQEKIQAMFGSSLTLTDEHRAWWSYVGHFYRVPGYVYAYAFGNLLAYSVYRRYRELGSADFTEAYLDFLSLGGSQAPDQAVRKVGMDITDPSFWDSGLEIVSDMVSEVERLAGEAGENRS